MPAPACMQLSGLQNIFEQSKLGVIILLSIVHPYKSTHLSLGSLFPEIGLLLLLLFFLVCNIVYHFQWKVPCNLGGKSKIITKSQDDAIDPK